ncbi:MAG: copper amine oxidase N-terminal domain-containing protein [Clostridia bacterium]|nr:copper amine oxidase N-terminal domain-containing protein [Clostridia bacterium]
MKKKLSMLLAVAMLVSAFCLTGAAAADTTATTSDSIGSSVLTVKYNGEAVVLPDALPFIDVNGRTLIPVRFVAETMGADVTWNQETQTAVIEQNGITVMVPIGSDTITVTKDGSTDTDKMDTQAVLAEDRTYVPIRFVAEALGAWVSYSDLFSTVQIYRDVLTPEEITRLHGYYDMTWEEYCKSNGESNHGITDAKRLESYPQLAYFSGSYWFENANEWKLRNPNGIEVLKQPARTPINYVGVVSSLTYTYGTQPDIDFANLVLAEARGVENEINGAGKVTIALETDLSCVYFSRHSNTAGTYVRGVLTVNIPKNADISWIKKNYDFISDPKAGETRNIDVEIYVNTFTANVHWSSMTAIK